MPTGERPTGTARWRRGDHEHACWAERTHHVAAIPALLASGLNGETALRLAVSAGSIEAVDALLNAALTRRPTRRPWLSFSLGKARRS